MANKKFTSRDERGQSTIEFALTLVLLLGIVLFFLQISLVFAYGNYAHYATFMAARAYLAAGPSQEDQETRAKAVIGKMLKKGDSGPDRFPTIAVSQDGDESGIKGVYIKPDPKFSPTDPNLSWMQGVRYKFRSKLFMLPLGKLSDTAKNAKDPLNSVTLTSESWLGRDPPYDECQAEMKRFQGIFDNGC